jgi:shikimate kinase
MMLSLFEGLDPRLAPALRDEFQRRQGELVEPLPRGVTVVLAGHRAAGKTRLLPKVARLLGREAFELDEVLARGAGRPLKEWLAEDEPGFRRAEVETFRSLPPGGVVAVGGGFLSLHPRALRGAVVVLVPVSFETYGERLRRDRSRPRLRPHLTLEEELEQVYAEREALHRATPTLSMVDFALRGARGLRPRRVVTLPPGQPPGPYAALAAAAGADLLEVRTDLAPPDLDLAPAAAHLPLIVSQRTDEVPEAWVALAHLVDRPLERGGQGAFVSFHAEAPLLPAAALALWEHLAPGGLVKHIEPMGTPAQAMRLAETREGLAARFGADRVTVLPMGPLALPFRAVLARRNALDFVALDGSWSAAGGQRLLADAVREQRRPPGPDPERRRLGILGHGLAASRSPRIHRAPFDRLDLPPDADLAALLPALRPHYAGFAVTNPFKKAAARAVGARRDAVNTLVRAAEGWTSDSTDVEGARAALERLGARSVTVLGDGGVGEALREAAQGRFELTFLKAADAGRPLTGAVLWTWPPAVQPPPGLTLHGARVGLITYGAPARRLARVVEGLGGTPVRLGPRWLVAQARRQRALWESAT